MSASATDEENLEENKPLLNDSNYGSTKANDDENERDARKRLHVIRHGSEREIRLLVVVEEWRLCFYLSFVVSLIAAIVLTKVFVEGDFAKTLREVFGVVNACVYLDFPPSTYVMPTLWSISLLFMYGYTVVSLFRVWVAKEEGKMSYTSFVVYVVLFLYVVLSFIFFTTVFAIKPSADDPMSIKLHVIPYFNWSIAWFVMYVLVAWFGEKVAWTNMGFHPCLKYFNRVMVGIQAITTVGNCVTMINSLADVKNGLWWKPSAYPTVTLVLQVIYYMWLVSVFVWPIILCAYITYKRHRSHCVYVTFSDNREASVMTASTTDEEKLRENIPLLKDHNYGGTNTNDENERDARKRLHVIHHGSEREIRLLVVVEEWRLAFYVTFISTLIAAIILTTVFVEGDYAKIIRDVFGVVDVCVFLDFPPATYVLPTLWSICLLFMYGYAVVSLFRVWVAKEEGKISYASFVVYVVLLVYVVLSFMFFTTVFAIKPSLDDPMSIKIHTIPYFNWSIAWFVMYVLIAWFGEKVAWTNMGLHPRLIYFNRVMVGILAITTVAVCVIMINSLADVKNGFWWKPSAYPTVTQMLQAGYYLWLVSVYVWPIIMCGYLTHKGHRSHCLYVSFSDNREADL